MVSFIIPAHNEASLIAATIAAVYASAKIALGSRPYEVIVVDDASTDGTGAIAAAQGARVVTANNRQISKTRNAGAAAAARDVPAESHLLIFVDADTLVTPQAISEALAAIDGGAVVGGGAVRFDGEVPLYARLLLPIMVLTFRMLRFAGGAFFFARRDHFEAVGGWDNSVFAGEEIELARALKRRGRFAFVVTPVVTSGRKLRTYSAGEILKTMMAITVGGRRAVKNRDKLALWYEPRRPDSPGASHPK